MSCNKVDNTITFDERAKGWTSFHSYFPDFMTGMNNKFFSFNGGDLYIHNSDNVPRNTFYGVQYPSRVSVMVNQSPSDIKEFQALAYEGNVPWNALLQAFVGMSDDFIQSTIDEVEFVRKEGIWYAYARRNEDVNHTDSKSTYGIGQVTDVSGSVVTVNGGSSLLTFGDSIIKGNDLSATGTVVTNSFSNGLTTMELTGVGTLTVGDFVFGRKDARTEGGSLRGYVIKIDLDVTDNGKVELFGVNSEVAKSYASL